MNRWIVVFILSMLFSCHSSDKQQPDAMQQSADIRRLESKVDSLNRIIHSISGSKPDTINTPVTSEIKPGTPSLEITPRPVQVPVKKVTEPMQPSTPKKAETQDTVRFFYKNSNKISVVISPWKEGRRTIQLFDPWGQLTYMQEDALLSYSNISEIKSFHPNGAVSQMSESLNPGGGIQHYQSMITFGINNEPEWKTVSEYPATLENMTNNQWYWSKKEKTWKKQEVIIETIRPE